MSLRDEARDLAEQSIASAVRELPEMAGAAIDAIDRAIQRRIEWRWKNAPLLYWEAEHMLAFLHMPEDVVGPIRYRGIKLTRWSRRRIRFAAMAWAQDPSFAEHCKICRA